MTHTNRWLISVVLLLLLQGGGMASGSVRSDLSARDVVIQHYDIFRKDRPIGTHTVSIKRHGNMHIIESSTRISVSLLGFEVYRFKYASRETWDDAGLLQLTAIVDDDGEKAGLEGRRQDGRFIWSDGKAQRSHAMPVYPTNHWNSAVLEQQAVLNTLTGKINTVTIHKEGVETLKLADAGLTATRYRYDGQLQLKSWYDDAGRWIAMQFISDDGSTIRYQCRNCRAQAGT